MSVADPFGLVGQVLDGQFRVDTLVGEGGFSAVYRGHHLGLNEPIAIKSLKLPSSLDGSLVDTFVQRFRDESRILYRLSQGNLHIVRSIAAGTTAATDPLVRGKLFDSPAGRCGRLSLATTGAFGVVSFGAAESFVESVNVEPILTGLLAESLVAISVESVF